MKTHLSELVSDRIAILGKSIKNARDSFYSAGFVLPVRFLALIESLRNRSLGEFDYQYYLDEVFGEAINLAVPWQPRARDRLNISHRSSYLDFLASQCNKNSVTLDANYSEYLKGRLDVGVITSQDKLFRDQKLIEMSANEKHLENLSSAAMKNLQKGFVEISSIYNFDVIKCSSGYNKSLSMKSSIDSKVRLLIRVGDFNSIINQGFLAVEYIFDDLPRKIFGLDSFVPGGFLYSIDNKNHREIIFSFLVQCRFAAALATPAKIS